MPKNIAIITITIIALIFLGGAGAYILVKESEFPETKVPEEVLPPSLPEELQEGIIPTEKVANWKIYSNEDFGFTLRYPPELTLTHSKSLDCKPLFDEIDKTFLGPIEQLFFQDQSGNSLGIVICDNPLRQSINRLLEGSCQGRFCVLGSEKVNNVQVTTMKSGGSNINIGITEDLFSQYAHLTEGDFKAFVESPKGSAIILINVQARKFNIGESLFNQILHTFETDSN